MAWTTCPASSSLLKICQQHITPYSGSPGIFNYYYNCYLYNNIFSYPVLSFYKRNSTFKCICYIYILYIILFLRGHHPSSQTQRAGYLKTCQKGRTFYVFDPAQIETQRFLQYKLLYFLTF